MSEKKLYKVYLLICENTHMGYVGQTCLDINHRCLHGKGYRPGTKIREAFDLYGESNFTCIILEEGLNKEEANEREKYWIQYLGTLYPNGMNLESGGKHSNVHPITLQKMKEVHKGHFVSLETRQKQSEVHCKKVLQYTKDGKFVKEYKSVKEAESQTKINHISKACLGKLKTAGNYIWRYAS